MTTSWSRRAAAVAFCAVAALLSACGSGSTESQLHPTRIVSFGDAFSDLGQGGSRYTVNDGSINVWIQQLAARFGTPLNTAASGGTSFARGVVRVQAKPDAAGGSTLPTVKEQVDAYLASGTFGANDLVVVNGGISDIVAETQKVIAGTQTAAQASAAVAQAGRDLGTLVRRLTQAGGVHVVVVGPYNLGRSPYAITTGRVELAQQLSGKFNEELLLSIVDLGAKVLYVDVALYYNLVTASPAAYTMTNANTQVCTSVDPGPGIGAGAGEVNSALCTPATIAPGANYATYVFADRLYPAPQAHRLFGDYAYDRIRARW